MADVQGKVKRIIEEYVDQGEYFTINRARQYGKTTILYLVQEKLKELCVVLSISLEVKEECAFRHLWRLNTGMRMGSLLRIMGVCCS